MLASTECFLLDTHVYIIRWLTVKKVMIMMRCHATCSVAAKYMYDVAGCDLIARAITNIYAVIRNFCQMLLK